VSDRSSSAFHWLRDSSLQIVSALIGSSLLVTIITTLYSEINQPNVYIIVTPHIIPPGDNDDIDSKRNPRVDYYETIVKNNGKKQATNMTLSMYFYGRVEGNSFFASETVEDPTVNQRMSDNRIVARLIFDGDQFELLVNPDPALEYKDGKGSNISNALVSEEIYSDANRGWKASGEKMMKHFNTTNRTDVAKRILEEGKLQNISKVLSLLRWDIPRLAPGGLMIFLVDTDEARKFDSYYITATFDEGSQTYPEITGYDIRSERFPNILAGQQDSQTIQLLLIIFVVLCAISFTIVITHKSIKDVIKKRRESRKWKKIKFDLFLAVPILILSSILVMYVCEEIPRSIVLQSLIIPPLDATEGASVDQEVVTIGNTNYTQGTLLLSAGIFWMVSFFARSLLTYFIAKIIIKKLYPDKNFPNRFLVSASIFITGVPLTSSIILFFNKSTYNIDPVYLFFLFLVIDIIRMLILVLLIPKILAKNNDLPYYGLIAISLVAGLSHLLLFTMLLELDLSEEPPKPPYQLVIFCLIAGLLQLTQIILTRSKEESRKPTRPRSVAAASISVGLIILWIWIIYYVTTESIPILYTDLPIILIGIVVIVLDIIYIGILRLITIRKIRKVTLELSSLETAHNGNNTSSEPCFPVSAPIKVKGKLKYNDSSRKLNGKQIILDNGEPRGGGNSTKCAITDEEGNFESQEVIAPSHVGTFKMQAHFEGFSCWSNNFLFTIEVTPSTDSEERTYNTRLRNLSLSISTGTVDRDGVFIPKKEFEPGELITFVVSLFDTDANTPLCGETNIRLMLYGEDIQKVTNPLPPTDSEGKTYASVLAPSTALHGWIFQAHYPGNSIYSSVNSTLGSYSTVVPVTH
jgi:hypothetical protein